MATTCTLVSGAPGRYEFLCMHSEVQGPFKVVVCLLNEGEAKQIAEDAVESDPRNHNLCPDAELEVSSSDEN